MARRETQAPADCAEMLAAYPVVTEVQVRWHDMDVLGHVNNVQYFDYFEMGRISYLEKMGVWQPETGWTGMGVILASTSCRFKTPVTYPDTILVGTRVCALATDRIMIENLAVSREQGVVVAEGKAVIVSYDYEKKRKKPWSEEQRAAITRLEGREPPPPT
jgi:acyl-CoA thioester hydrolase